MTASGQVPPVLQPFVGQRTILLHTRKRDGSWVPTPVNIAVEGEHAYVRTYGKSGKAKRLRNFPEVRFCPSTPRGEPTGTTVTAHARLLEGTENRHASTLLARKHRLLHGVVVPLTHRMWRTSTLHYELSDVHESADGPPTS
jgi:PPOX class probable F420-dependent enzyme